MARRQPGEGGLRQLANGTWRGEIDLGWVGGKRKRRAVYGRTQTECRRKLDAAKREKEAGILASRTITVEKWLRQWLDHVAKDVKPGTLATYRSKVERNIIPTIGKVRLDKLTSQHVRALHDATLAATGSATNVMHVHRVLHNALVQAAREELVSRVITQTIKAPKRRAPKPEEKYLSADQARAILTAASGSPLLSRWQFALLLGARQGECLGLRWDFVDLDAGFVDLAWSLSRVNYSHGCGETDPKHRPASCPQRRCLIPDSYESEHLTGNSYLLRPKSLASRRIVPLLPSMIHSLKALAAASGPNPHGLVWHRPDGKPISGRQDWAAWHELLDAAGVTPYPPLHECRHAAATLLLDAGVDAKVVGAILGHSDVVVTRSYQRVDRRLMLEALAGSEQLLTQGKQIVTAASGDRPR